MKLLLAKQAASGAATRLAIAAVCWSVPSVTLAQARPQVVFAVGNSESMDGTLSGAIMTGSGMYSGNASLSSLSTSSSPVDYSVPPGFMPPKQAANGVGVASRTIIWPLVKQMRVLFVPVLHGLHRRLALEC